jgi:hypothetical protein
MEILHIKAAEISERIKIHRKMTKTKTFFAKDKMNKQTNKE